MSQVSIIITTLLSNPQLLKNCLTSLDSLKTPPQFEVIVVGNVTEGALKKIQKDVLVSYPVQWLALGKNQGFAGAVNAGISASKSEYLVMLNDDTTVDPNWLTQLVKQQTTTKADMVASTIYLADKQTLDSEGFTFAWRGKAEALKDGTSSLGALPDHWLKEKQFFIEAKDDKFWQEPFGSDAAACLYTRNLIEKVGMFDESFFAYLEDVDLAWRARMAGLRCALASKAVVYHHKHATSSKMSNFKAQKDFENWWHIVVKYPDTVWAKLWWPILEERLRNLSGWVKSWF